MSRSRRILFLQFTNPGAYPPLEHSSRILAERGWDVLFLGTSSRGSARLDLPPHPRIRVERRVFVEPGFRQKAEFAAFSGWCVRRCLEFTPDWVYASDALSTPAALAVLGIARTPVVYHEHDAPAAPSNRFQRFVHESRRLVAGRAVCCVLPNEARRAAFARAMPGPECLLVWNCPSLHDLPEGTYEREGEVLRAYFHGNLGVDYTPRSLFEAFRMLGDGYRLTMRGYDVSGRGLDVARIGSWCRELGLEQRVELLPPVPTRAELWSGLAATEVGLAIFPMEPHNFNVRHLAGASNKIFDYLAASIPVIVPRRKEWIDLVVKPGYGIACDTSDSESIADALRWIGANRDKARSMGAAGRQRILADWNYETQFRPVLDLLEGGA